MLEKKFLKPSLEIMSVKGGQTLADSRAVTRARRLSPNAAGSAHLHRLGCYSIKDNIESQQQLIIQRRMS